MAAAIAQYVHDGVAVTFGEDGEVASDTTVIREGARVHATTDHLLAPNLETLLGVSKRHIGGIGAKLRTITYLDAFVEQQEGGETFYHWIVTYLGEPVRLPKGVVSVD
jgi:hypothetical protein